MKNLREVYSEQLVNNIQSDSIVILKNAINDLESHLTNEHHKRIGNDDLMSKNWRSIKDNLKEGEMAIEFGNFRVRMGKYHYVTDSIAYIAYIIKPDQEKPIYTYLFEEKELRSLLKDQSPDKLYASRGELFNAVMNDRTILSDSLYSLIWSKIDPHTTGVEKIYISPSGILHAIPFSALANKKGEMLSERFELHMTSSAYSIQRDQDPVKLQSTLLIGGIDYQFSPGTETIAQIETSQFEQANERLGRSKGSNWNYLPGTLTEVEGIQSLLIKRNIPSTILKSDQASEEAFNNISDRNHAVIHVATHGFFFPKRSGESLDQLNNQFINADDPLLRSGLILSGANYAWKNGNNPYRKEDGILTALEISNMDLSNVDLVVLSACETGLGESDVSDGIYGLQRAFKMAGAERILMSLWEVPDKETAEYMQLLYANWLDTNDLHSAYQNTQKEMREKYPNEPRKWAGFVLSD